MITSLLDQKREMFNVQASLDRLEKEFEQERIKAREKALAHVQNNFEQVDSGIGRLRDRSDRRSRSPERRDDTSKRDRSRSGIGSSSLSDLPARIAAQAERRLEETMERLAEERTQAKRAKIPAYWLPSLTPSAETSKEEIVKRTEEALRKGLETKCYIGDKFGHVVTSKSLVDVHFVIETIPKGEQGDRSDKERKICPSCKKTLSNVNKLFAIRKCGHIHCSTCIDTLIRPALKEAEKDKKLRPTCLECDAPIKSDHKDILPLQREGTGFTSAGNNEAKTMGVSFQG
ncbi:uncharacterized protein FA14DRAFT_159795 [Meira miltonrushii]|uniref:RING-type domain-containing protein n=1 Tax=Meira miltonrushii TaxID=1280837 RepID=A0A316VNN5_9BASI|nr:uncharacterized protein FA14DRAFT_159795 [Meira miltonrushii]PWN38033.1 hypothetical protein FA14DRAFT_159795 [Meira miltonrushii]